MTDFARNLEIARSVGSLFPALCFYAFLSRYKPLYLSRIREVYASLILKYSRGGTLLEAQRFI